MELDAKIKIEILKNKIGAYQQSLYSVKLDYRVAEMLENEQGKTNAEQSTKDILRAIEFLENELNTLCE